MGIHNIHILTEPEKARLALQAQEALEGKMIRDHQMGKHPPGRMRRECPLCRRNR